MKMNPVGDSMESNKISLENTQAVDKNGLHKAAEKFLSQQVKTPSGKQTSVLDGHVQRGLEVRTGDYITYPAGSKYMDLVEYLKRDTDHAKRAQSGRNMLARMRSCVKHQRS